MVSSLQSWQRVTATQEGPKRTARNHTKESIENVGIPYVFQWPPASKQCTPGNGSRASCEILWLLENLENHWKKHGFQHPELAARNSKHSVFPPGHSW